MIFREMRRKKQALSQQEIAQILQQETSGVLALIGDEAYPYAVPISYVYDGEKLYFHSAKSGHKLDAIQQNAKASFCGCKGYCRSRRIHDIFSKCNHLWADTTPPRRARKKNSNRETGGQIRAGSYRHGA